MRRITYTDWEYNLGLIKTPNYSFSVYSLRRWFQKNWTFVSRLQLFWSSPPTILVILGLLFNSPFSIISQKMFYKETRQLLGNSANNLKLKSFLLIGIISVFYFYVPCIFNFKSMYYISILSISKEHSL